MEQHSCANADAIAVHRGDKRRLAQCERAEKAPDGDLFPGPARRFEEIREVVSGREILTLREK